MKFTQNVMIDVFAVGGGGSGSDPKYYKTVVPENTTWGNRYHFASGGGGGGGYTATQLGITISANTTTNITVGEGGAALSPHTFSEGITGGTSIFNYNNSEVILSANGGKGGTDINGGAGGSGGGSGGEKTDTNRAEGFAGGTDGADGVSKYGDGGKGQGTTTREFGEETGTLYSTGGTGKESGTGAANTGDGGGGATGRVAVPSGYGWGGGSGSGGSGIVVIRNIRSAETVMLNYESNGGSECSSKEVFSGSIYGTLCKPVKVGYTFMGWYTDENYTEQITPGKAITYTDDFTIYALWNEGFSYSCANNSSGSNPIFTYSGNCTVVHSGDSSDWKVKLLSSGTLKFNSEVNIDAFLVGAGGSGKCYVYDGWNYLCPNGGGGYHKKIQSSLAKNTIYSVIIGQPNGGTTSAFNYIAEGGGNGYGTTSSDNYSGKGGSAVYEFYESTGDTLYSGVNSVEGGIPPANTGRGGNPKAPNNMNGSSGIVIIRNIR